ncbi:MAG: ankyrin repeat domain-containing protein [Epsilonproteobacteria bacterium]|nr:ankyrin repeat domain-containing protein [Campylobacterota bacterium]
MKKYIFTIFIINACAASLFSLEQIRRNYSYPKTKLSKDYRTIIKKYGGVYFESDSPEKTISTTRKKEIQLIKTVSGDVSSAEKLFDAIFNNDYTHAKHILENTQSPQIVVNVQDHKGKTPLYCAVLYADEEMIDLLLHHGADVTIELKKSDAPSVLHAACQWQPWTVVLKLINRHPTFKENINYQPTILSKTLLYTACESQNTDVVRSLLAMGANKEAALTRFDLDSNIFTISIDDLPVCEEIQDLLNKY